MKVSLVLVGLVLASALMVQAQLSSSECLEEIKAVYGQIDHEQAMASGEARRLAYTHQYIMRKDETSKKVTAHETMVYANKFYWLDTPEFQTCSDAKEAFHYRKFQFTVYRTKSNMAEAALIAGVDKGLWAHATVTFCDFIPVPGNDTLRHKQARMTISPEGQKKYAVSEVDMIWNPLNGQLVALGVSFTEPSLYKWARFDFESFTPPVEPVAAEVKAVLYDGEGKLRGDFGGAEVLDYR